MRNNSKLMRNKVLATFCMNLGNEFEDKYSSIQLFILMRKELTGPKSGLTFALDLAE